MDPKTQSIVDFIHSQAINMNKNMMGGFTPPRTGHLLNDFILQSLIQGPMGLGSQSGTAMGLALSKPFDPPPIDPTTLAKMQSLLPKTNMNISNIDKLPANYNKE